MFGLSFVDVLSLLCVILVVVGLALIWVSNKMSTGKLKEKLLVAMARAETAEKQLEAEQQRTDHNAAVATWWYLLCPAGSAIDSYIAKINEYRLTSEGYVGNEPPAGLVQCQEDNAALIGIVELALRRTILELILDTENDIDCASALYALRCILEANGICEISKQQVLKESWERLFYGIQRDITRQFEQTLTGIPEEKAPEVPRQDA